QVRGKPDPVFQVAGIGRPRGAGPGGATRPHSPRRFPRLPTLEAAKLLELLGGVGGATLRGVGLGELVARAREVGIDLDRLLEQEYCARPVAQPNLDRGQAEERLGGIRVALERLLEFRLRLAEI